MQATRPSIRRLAWLVSLTILLAALLPSLSHAMLRAMPGTAAAAAFAEICSATGARFVRIDLAGNASTDLDASAGVAVGADVVAAVAGADGKGGKGGKGDSPARTAMDCPYCAIHHGAPALPPAGLSWTPPDALRFEPPRLFLAAPRPLFAWAPALARGPPVLS